MTWLAFEKWILGCHVEKPKGLEALCRGEISRLAAGREIKARQVEKAPVMSGALARAAKGARQEKRKAPEETDSKDSDEVQLEL